MDNCEVLRYKYLAFLIIRDAIGFHFGIPQFLNEENLQLIQDRALAEKLGNVKKQKNRDLTSCEIERCIKSVNKAITARINELKEDFKHTEEVLFKDNLWLQWLGLDPEFLKSYLDKLSKETKDSLAVVPKWGIPDHSLGRNYINDKFSYRVNLYE